MILLFLSHLTYLGTSHIQTWALAVTSAAAPPPTVTHQLNSDSLGWATMPVISTEQPMILFNCKSDHSALLLKPNGFLSQSPSQSPYNAYKLLHDLLTSPQTIWSLSPHFLHSSSLPSLLSPNTTGRIQPQDFVPVPSAARLLPHLVSCLQVSAQMPPYQEGLPWISCIIQHLPSYTFSYTSFPTYFL